MDLRRRGVWTAGGWLVALALGACRAPVGESPAARAAHAADDGGPATEDVAAIRRTLDELYAAFCFDAGKEADWERIRASSIDGAVWVAPIAPGAAARGDGTDAFVQGFRAAIHSSPELARGFHERIVHARIDRFGTVAHAWVAFEGFVPGDGRALTRGLDSLQLVFVRGEWRVASFTTQYEGGELSIPSRFLALRDRD
ncbi:MAG: hypothetical protein IT453_18105 [Planctomycetes bacterium]|nr:hypothetical protein [Planctomycetota bacterium]